MCVVCWSLCVVCCLLRAIAVQCLFMVDACYLLYAAVMYVFDVCCCLMCIAA